MHSVIRYRIRTYLLRILILNCIFIVMIHIIYTYIHVCRYLRKYESGEICQKQIFVEKHPKSIIATNKILDIYIYIYKYICMIIIWSKYDVVIVVHNNNYDNIVCGKWNDMCTYSNAYGISREMKASVMIHRETVNFSNSESTCHSLQCSYSYLYIMNKLYKNILWIILLSDFASP